MKQLRWGFMLCSISVFILAGCDLNLRKGYRPSVSKTLEESKDLKVFLKEYEPVEFQYDDSVKFQITKAYAETIFFRDDTIRKIDECQIVLYINGNKFLGIPDYDKFSWRLENFGERYASGIGGDPLNCILVNLDLNSSVAPDSFLVYVVTSTPRGNNLRNRVDTVGSLYLVAK